MRNNKTALVVSIVVLFLLFCLIAIVIGVYRQHENRIGSMGIIRGSLSFPSEGIPSALMVCAEEVKTGQRHCLPCTKTGSGDICAPAYELSVPAGEYFVYAELGSERAYYSDFVACGLRADCPSHNKITIVVEPNEAIEKIDPGDWYMNVKPIEVTE